jgi:hypothetical protein
MKPSSDIALFTTTFVTDRFLCLLHAVEWSGSARRLRDLFQPGAVILPPRRVTRWQVAGVWPQARRSVDELPDDVGVTSVPVRLSDHVDQDPVQVHLGALARPPRDVADDVEVQGVESLVRSRPAVTGPMPNNRVRPVPEAVTRAAICVPIYLIRASRARMSAR